MVRKVNQTLKYFSKKQKHGENMAKLGRTRGRVKHNAFDNRVYYKPTIGKAVIRTKGVDRRSKAVIARNEKLEALEGKPEHPVTACVRELRAKYPEEEYEHIPADALWECLSDKMRAL